MDCNTQTVVKIHQVHLHYSELLEGPVVGFLVILFFRVEGDCGGIVVLGSRQTHCYHLPSVWKSSGGE